MAFRQTLVCLKRFRPSPSAPSQILLRLVEKIGSPTASELWETAAKEHSTSFNSKNHMKKILQFLCKSERLETKPKDPQNHKVNFIYKLGRRPDILRVDSETHL